MLRMRGAPAAPLKAAAQPRARRAIASRASRGGAVCYTARAATSSKRVYPSHVLMRLSPCAQEWILDKPRQEPYRAKEETTAAKEGPAPAAPSGEPAQAPPVGSSTDRRVTAAELHGTQEREDVPHNKVQPLDISAVRPAHRCVVHRGGARRARRRRPLALRQAAQTRRRCRS